MSAKDKLKGAGRFVRDNISNVERLPPDEKPAIADGKPPLPLVIVIGGFAAALAACVLAVALLRGPA